MSRHRIDREAFCAELKRANMTQKEAARLVGMSENSLSRKVLGQRDFSLGEVAALCRLLNMADPASVFRLKED